MKALVRYFLVWGATFISICGLTVGMARPVDGKMKTLVAKIISISDPQKEMRDDGKNPFSSYPQEFNHLKISQKQSIESRLRILNGAWEGIYYCDEGQGLTRLRLVIEAKSTIEIDALFIFSAHPRNPSVPSGSFRMKGLYNAFNSPEIPDQLVLKATTWINRPSGYQTVDLRGNIFLDEGRIVGEVVNLGRCSRFDVVKER
ncbi:MAG: hypothetical protein AB4080_08460 [Trichodesmium sp.]